MAKPAALVLNRGGMHSLVATAMACQEGPVALLFVHDGLADSAPRHLSYLRQAEHFQIDQRHELNLPHLQDAAHGPALDLFGQLQVVAAGVSLAQRLGAARVIWPIAAGERFQVFARLTEALMVLGELADSLQTPVGEIHTPLLELTGREVVELGQPLGVAWQLSRSCQRGEAKPCGTCDGCQQRRQAFEQAGVVDPLVGDATAASA